MWADLRDMMFLVVCFGTSLVFRVTWYINSVIATEQIEAGREALADNGVVYFNLLL